MHSADRKVQTPGGVAALPVALPDALTAWKCTRDPAQMRMIPPQ